MEEGRERDQEPSGCGIADDLLVCCFDIGQKFLQVHRICFLVPYTPLLLPNVENALGVSHSPET
jgi:hypothetical protein